MAHDGIETPLEPSFVQRVAQGLRYVISGVGPGNWFGPSQPLTPIAQGVAGRQFDFPVGYNLRITPRQSEGITFEQMRALADGYDVLRTVIETRKDQMVKMRWCVKPVDDKVKTKDDPRIKEVQNMLRMPDGVNPWQMWLRMLLEEMFVTDAAALYPVFSQGDELLHLDLIDGATIKPLLGEDGRIPKPPSPAYQQVLKGVPAADYTLDQLLYAPRNKRVWKVYGYSPVEQIIMTVNIALRRQLHQLQYYTEGSVPDLLISTPATWNPTQIAEFDAYFQSKLAGDTGQRRQATFVPDGTKPFNTKDQVLKDEYDEWLARVVCFAFSIPPTPFIRQMNRATAETAKDAAMEEGLVPVMQWVKDLMDVVIWKYKGYTDLEFGWDDEEALDPVQQSQIDDTDIKNGSKSIDEVRLRRGDAPIGMGPAVFTMSGPVLIADVLADSAAIRAATGGKSPSETASDGNPANDLPGAGDDAVDEEQTGAIKGAYLGSKLRKAAARTRTIVKPIDRERAEVTTTRATLTDAIKTFLSAESARVAKQLVTALDLARKADDPHTRRVDQALQGLDMSSWTMIVDVAGRDLGKVATDGAAEAFAQILVTPDASQLDQVNQRALDWARMRAAEMVGKKWVDGQLVDNPNAEWSLPDATREMIRSDVVAALDGGLSSDELADTLLGNYAFSAARAETIARTELLGADVEGNMQAYRASNQVAGKEWAVGAGCCEECAAVDGEIVGLDEQFSNGLDASPAHPNCRCDVLPVLKDEE